jgi:hypothetical protein
MAVKNKDGTLDCKPANYERDTHPVGINFELKDGTALFAPIHFYLMPYAILMKSLFIIISALYCAFVSIPSVIKPRTAMRMSIFHFTYIGPQASRRILQ